MLDPGGLAGRGGALAARMAFVAAVVVAFTFLSRVATPLVRRLLDRRRRPSYTRVFSGLFRAAVVLVGSLFALTLAFPSVRVG